MIFTILNSIGGLDYFVNIIIVVVSILISLTLHEVAHGVVAMWNGDYTAKYAGRLSLNPLKHIDIMGFLMLVLVGFGFAKPVPVNPTNFRHQKKGIFTVAIAGVTVNLILAIFCSMFAGLIIAYGDLSIGFLYYLANFFVYMTQLNFFLIFFNLLPIAPLDGFRVVEAFTRYNNRYCRFMRESGRFILLGLVMLSFIVSMIVENTNAPYWFTYFDLLGTYLDNTAGWCNIGMVQLWQLIFR